MLLILLYNKWPCFVVIHSSGTYHFHNQESDVGMSYTAVNVNGGHVFCMVHCAVLFFFRSRTFFLSLSLSLSLCSGLYNQELVCLVVENYTWQKLQQNGFCYSWLSVNHLCCQRVIVVLSLISWSILCRVLHRLIREFSTWKGRHQLVYLYYFVLHMQLHAHMYMHAHTHTYYLSLYLSHTHTYTHTQYCKDTHSLSLALSPSLKHTYRYISPSLSPSLSLSSSTQTHTNYTAEQRMLNKVNIFLNNLLSPELKSNT